MPILGRLFPLWHQAIGPTQAPISEGLVWCVSVWSALLEFEAPLQFPVIIQTPPATINLADIHQWLGLLCPN